MRRFAVPWARLSRPCGPDALGPTLSITPTTLNFLSQEGTNAPPSQIFGIDTNDGVVASFTITASEP